MSDKTKVIFSSDSLLHRIRNLGFVPEEYVEVSFTGGSFYIYGLERLSCEYSGGPAKYQVKCDSFISLTRLLKTIADQPITLTFGSHNGITIDGIML